MGREVVGFCEVTGTVTDDGLLAVVADVGVTEGSLGVKGVDGLVCSGGLEELNGG